MKKRAQFDETPGNNASTTWRTPPWIIEMVREIYGGRIECDPCASSNNLFWFAETNISKENDGLNIAHAWGTTAFLNPPYGRELRKWTEAGKFRHETFENTAEQTWLVPARLDTRWWRTLMSYAGLVAIFPKRVAFVGAEHGAKFPSALIYCGPNELVFYYSVRKYGLSIYKHVK